MQRYLITLSVALLSSVLGLSLTACNKPAQDSTTASGQTAAKQETTEAAAKQYTCPMHPEIVQDAPGQCSICGMDLVEKS